MKYYIKSGQLEYVMAGPHIESEKDAACESILCLKDKILNGEIRLAPSIMISQRGLDLFDHEVKEDICFNTKEILKESGLITKE